MNHGKSLLILFKNMKIYYRSSIFQKAAIFGLHHLSFRIIFCLDYFGSQNSHITFSFWLGLENILNSFLNVYCQFRQQLYRFHGLNELVSIGCSSDSSGDIRLEITQAIANWAIEHSSSVANSWNLLREASVFSFLSSPKYLLKI